MLGVFNEAIITDDLLGFNHSKIGDKDIYYNNSVVKTKI